MKTVAYCNPFVPPEWIAAHGLQPSWLRLNGAAGRRFSGTGRAVCPYAGTVIDAALSGMQAAAFVMTTTCDQMRSAAAVLQRDGDLPVFLMNVPSTWQTVAAGQLYLDELERLSRFLVRLGGKVPTNGDLADVMSGYDDGRAELQSARPRLSAGQFARAVAGLRGTGTLTFDCDRGDSPRPGVALAIVGGPLLEEDHAILNLIELAGGRVVLDATEGGERTLPAAFDQRRIRDNPLAELVRAYFGTIPDVFRRPNDALYRWLGQQLAVREVRGIVFRRYVWCDIWHAELARLKQWSPVPVLEIDVGDDDDSLSRTEGQIEAFLEMLT